MRPEIEALAAEVGETIGHVNYNPATGTAIMETVAWGNTPLKYGLATGVEIPLYAGAAGKAILAFAPPEVVDQQVLVPLNPNTITNLDELRAQLVQIRENGWATGDGERIPDAYGVAAPIFTNGNVTGSVTISIPSYRSHETDLRPAQHRTHPHHQQNQPTTQHPSQLVLRKRTMVGPGASVASQR